jgi:acetyl esterase/lipase
MPPTDLLLLRDRPARDAAATPGAAQDATLTPFVLEGGPRPAFVVCPGGNLLERAAHEGAPIAAWLNRIGLHAFVLNYRLLPCPPTSILADAFRAVRYLRHHAARLRVDAERIGMIGFSGGGFITAFAGTRFENGEGASPEDDALTAALFPRDEGDPVDRESARLDAMVLAYPAVHLTPERIEGALTGVKLPLPEGMSPERAARYFSSDRHVTPRTPPTFLWVTATDQLGLCPDTLAFAGALSREQVPFELHVFPRGGHGLGLAMEEPAAAGWTGLCERWLRSRWG